CRKTWGPGRDDLWQPEAGVSALAEGGRGGVFKGVGFDGARPVSPNRGGDAPLHLITFFPAGETETPAWPIPQQTKAAQAAGKIHSDMERGFIRAEVYHYDDLLACGSEAKVKEKGLFRLEGKEYVIQEADIVYFRFNV